MVNPLAVDIQEGRGYVQGMDTPYHMVLDDMRSITCAYEEASLQSVSTVLRATLLVRTVSYAKALVQASGQMGLWILDNDLGPQPDGTLGDGLEFLKWAIREHPTKVAHQVVSCSSNPSRRRDINELFRNWRQAGQPVGTLYEP